jgi:hypothetical protein
MLSKAKITTIRSNFCDKREQLSLLKLPSVAKIMSKANNEEWGMRNGEWGMGNEE